MNNNQVDVSVVIVIYNCRNYALECLDSIFTYVGPIQTEVMVVDNASGDGTAGAIRELFPNVRLIENRENRWFRPAVNQGIRESQGRYVLLLNPDTRLLTSNGLTKMAQYMDTYPKIGILGVKLLDPDGKIQPDCERFPGLAWALCHYSLIHHIWPQNPVRRHWRYNGWERSDTRLVDSVSGACMMIRRQVFEQIGLLDERCRMYWEEADFCRSAHKAGWKTVHFADVEILHHWRQGGVSITPVEILEPLIEESMLHYYRKYYGSLVYWFLVLLSGLRLTLSRIFKHTGNHSNKF